MPAPLVAALALALPPVQDPAPAGGVVEVDAPIVEVVVHPGSALVRRRGELPAGAAEVAVRGLPAGLDPDGLRVRAEGAEVVSVELRTRVAPALPEARLAELEGRAAELRARVAALEDERDVLARTGAHLERLVRLDGAPAAGEDGSDDSPSTDAWAATLAYLGERLSELAEARRANERALEEARRALDEVRAALGGDGAPGGPVLDVLVDLVDLPAGPGGPEGPDALELAYVVDGAGWEPAYDLRADRRLEAVELVHRARVRQRTGEDWRDVELVLSTAEARRDTRAPEPEPVRLALRDTRVRRGADSAPASAAAPPAEDLADADAAVSDEGLSVRYRLPRRETVESRDEATSVRIGAETLAIDAEHVVVPALDPTAYVRGKARNTTAWTLRPGPASVFLGADLVGRATLPSVRPGEELVVPLGADPGLVVERVSLTDRVEEPGFLGSTRTRRTRWLVRLANRGALGTAGGAARVVVHETLPRPRDERIEVDLEKASPGLARGEPWDELREERAVLTWVVEVPPGGDREVVHETTVAWPQGWELVGGRP